MISRLAAILLVWAVFTLKGHSQQLAQALVDAPQPANAATENVPSGPASVRSCCTASQALRRFLSDSVGPYPIMEALFTAGLHQATDNPPEWRQGFPAFSERFGSNMGITAAGNAVRYGTAWAMKIDPRFHKCRCTGFGPRLGHAVKATAFARRQGSGSSVLSIPNLFAPYAATTAAVYAWYPSRYSGKDAFRMGNYNLLGTVGSNIAFEFMPPKVQDFLHRMHLSSARIASQKP